MLEKQMSELISVLREQTEALNALAESNFQLIQTMAMAEEDDDEPKTIKYLDGETDTL